MTSCGYEAKGRWPKLCHWPALPAVGFLFGISDEEPGTHGPRRVLKQELHNAFAQG